MTDDIPTLDRQPFLLLPQADWTFQTLTGLLLIQTLFKSAILLFEFAILLFEFVDSEKQRLTQFSVLFEESLVEMYNKFSS